ncbi:DUF4435 domain-containing protein [Kozakia baliensis]|uniref:DUF4435 domain-containing protein n=1 Tax=Kozakia baliensis TaxID=153496 RepID=UPI00087BE72D|nr:DUF4435 domain-containing protein [Kozakia baliensis]AOX19394.1 hypothetical protein A0U90_02780 [Kozakia baliensis]
MSRGKVKLTLDDIIATLKHSSLPNIVVEGSDDIVIYRRMEDFLSEDFVSVLPVYGRKNVLQIFKRKSEFKDSANVAFIADRDDWVYSEIPEEFVDENLIFTNGYSIENDAIRDGDFCRLMSPEEKSRFDVELDLILKWFAAAMQKFLDDEPIRISSHPEELLKNPNFKLSIDKILENDEAARILLDRLRADPFGLLRGKTLLAVIMRQLSYAGRAARHNHLALLDAVGANPKLLVSDIFERVKKAVASTEPRPEAATSILP